MNFNLTKLDWTIQTINKANLPFPHCPCQILPKMSNICRWRWPKVFQSFSLYFIFLILLQCSATFVSAAWLWVNKGYTIKSDIELESCSHCYFKEITINALEVLFDSHYSQFQTFRSFVIKTIVVFKTSATRQHYTN